MKKRMISFLVLIPLIAACQANITAGQPGASPQPSATAKPSASPSGGMSSHTVSDEQSLIAHLKMEGADVKAGEQLEQPFLSVKGKTYTVNGESIQVFEYASAQALEAEASQISPDGGSTKTTMISWMDTPHFFKKERVMVIYIGKNQAVLDLLRGALGPQFAGR